MWKKGKFMSYIRSVKRVESVPYGEKLGFYLLGDNCWIVSENGYFETDADDFKEKLYMMSIPSLSEKELQDLRTKIETKTYTPVEVKLYNYCIRRTNLYTKLDYIKNYIDTDAMPELLFSRYRWS